MKAFPWQRVMGFGFGVLRLSTRDFWRLTPRELAAAAEAVFGADVQPTSRAALDALLAAFPDTRSCA